MRITVIGGGMIGSLIAKDLNKDEHNEVIVFERDKKIVESLKEQGVNAVRKNFLSSNANLECDLAINALPGRIGYQALEKALNQKTNVVDISFMPEDPRKLDKLAKENEVFAIIDAGFAPGLTNIIMSDLANKHDIIDAKIMVGGLPQECNLPWEYASVFSPSDVLEEYTRAARVIKDGSVFIRPALSNVELLHVDGIGDLEAFETDGLRTLLDLAAIENMVEKTIRYPGHASKVKLLRDSGFLSTEEINGITPLEFTTEIMKKNWGKDMPDVSVMRIDIHTENGKDMRYEIIDKAKDGNSSMSRMTGYTCTAIVKLLNLVNPEPGIIAPENLYLIKEAIPKAIFADLEHNHGIKIKITEEK